VWLVIEPWVKLGTTGTARAGTALASTVPTAVTYRAIVFFITIYHYLTVSSVTNCVVTVVPAPPALGASSPVAKP